MLKHVIALPFKSYDGADTESNDGERQTVE